MEAVLPDAILVAIVFVGLGLVIIEAQARDH